MTATLEKKFGHDFNPIFEHVATRKISMSKELCDIIEGLSDSARKIADAITPSDAAHGHDATGGTISSLTEAVMGVTAAMVRIADAIESVASAIGQRSSE